MKVLKFGGTSVGSVAAFKKVISIVLQEKDAACIVVSAMGGITNLLLEAGELAAHKDATYLNVFHKISNQHLETVQELLPINNRSAAVSEIIVQLNSIESLLEGIYLLGDLSNKTLAKLSSSGELLSSYILQQALFLNENTTTTLLNSAELIKVEGDYLGAKVLKDITEENLKKQIKTTGLYILPGFICGNVHQEICTLGRGGSDYTASILAAAIDAEVLEIWTDVSGMYTTNPKLVADAYPIAQISYHEAMELSHFGAKVIYPPTILPVLQKEISICIKNTFKAEEEGTLISKTISSTKIASGISHVENITLLTLEGNGMVGIPGFSKRLFGALANEKINVVFITQASSEHSICFGILSVDEIKAQQIVNQEFAYEISLKKIEPISIENDLCILALVGDNMKNHQGISGKMFQALGNNNINIRAIAQGASERNISTVIHKKHIFKALNVLHEAFFQGHKLVLNLFIVGVGNVGSQLLEQLKEQHAYLKEELNINLKVIALANSKQLLLEENGISLATWKDDFSKAKSYDIEKLLPIITELNLPNTVFVDNTASEIVSEHYASFLKESIPVVTCNKIACSSDFTSYKNLKNLAKKYNAPLFFETNVGAGLPIINTLQNLIASGDKVEEIQAVLSGSLNFIFNTYKGKESFAEIVKQAGEQGYTEPDPRIDLSGKDVMRKILILARESGAEIEMEAITSNTFLPQSALNTKSVEDFRNVIADEEAHFQQIFENANSKGCQLKFVAKYTKNGASVGLEEIPSDHPFYNLKGSDNIILFYTKRYPEQPLIIKGAGAGAAVTASGIFADIIKLANS